MNLGIAEITEGKLADTIVAAGLGQLPAQECRNHRWRTRHALPNPSQPLEGGRARMRVQAAMLAVQEGEAVMPAWIGAARDRERSRIGVSHHDEAAEPHQRQ